MGGGGYTCEFETPDEYEITERSQGFRPRFVGRTTKEKKSKFKTSFFYFVFVNLCAKSYPLLIHLVYTSVHRLRKPGLSE
jgi:hypothetical protein